MAHRTSPTNIGMGLLATLAAHDLGFIRTRELVGADGGRARHHRAAGALRGPPAQLVRLRDPGSARSRATSPRWTAATWRARWSPWPRGCAGSAARRSPPARSCAGHGRHRAAAADGAARPRGGPGAAPRQRRAPGRGGGRGRPRAARRRTTRTEKLARPAAPRARAGVGAPLPGRQRRPARPKPEAAHWARQLIEAIAEGAPGARRARRRRGSRPWPAAPPRSRTAMGFRFLFDPQRRIFSIGYRLADAEGPGPPRSFLLRPPGLRGPPGQLPRHRQGRRAAGALVPPGAARHQRGRLPHLLSWSGTLFEYLMPLLLLRSYPETLLDLTLPHGRAPADQVRGGARRALGHLGVGVQRGRPPRQLPVQGLRRSRAWASSAASATSWWWRPTPPRWRPWWTRRRRRGTSGGWPGRGSAGAYGYYEAIDYTLAEGGRRESAPARRRAAAGRSSAPGSPTTRA